jgi:hypothetical protein
MIKIETIICERARGFQILRVGKSSIKPKIPKIDIAIKAERKFGLPILEGRTPN